MVKNECFKIRLLTFEKQSDFFDIQKGRPVYEIKAPKNPYILNPITIEADPFLFVKDGRLYLFYESKRWQGNGVLMMTSTSDIVDWTKPVTVLREGFHLSFPWVFEENGHVYMIPESGQDKSVRLYEATDSSLQNFKLVKKLLTSNDLSITMGYGDSCFIKHEGVYYLFTQLQYADGVNTLELYVSDDLAGNYIKHPMSPIQHSMKLGRNAGAALSIDGKIYRFSQDCTVKYGDNVHVSRIVKLTPEVYEEELVRENIIPQQVSFYKEGGHQFNAVEYNGQWVVATDAKEYHYLLTQRIINRIKMLYK